jgi:hypothetical protein
VARSRLGGDLVLTRGVKARRDEALASLLLYLDKTTPARIVDYERRAKAGKIIGSGRMEKAVDQAVGVRQKKKKKGMSWRARRAARHWRC